MRYLYQPTAVEELAVRGRYAWLAEGVACYKTFISGLLDITDNLVDGETVPPREVVRHDGDDSYLVVAADKGTATFSDIANGLMALPNLIGLLLLSGVVVSETRKYFANPAWRKAE